MRDKTAPEPIKATELTIVGANRASWADLQTIFGTADYPGKCYCQRFKTRDCHWSSLSDEERRARLREQTHCDDPGAGATTGVGAFPGGGAGRLGRGRAAHRLPSAAAGPHRVERPPRGQGGRLRVGRHVL